MPRVLSRRSSRFTQRRSLPSASTMDNGASSSSSSSVASTSRTPFKEELLCPICYEPFREAVTLCCGHNFCKGCVSRSWEHRPHVCPVCKDASSFKDLRINHTLNNLVEMILKEEEQQVATLCPVHHEEAKFFCLEDKELVCSVCQSSKQHKGHKMWTVQEAAADFKAKLKNMETSLREKAKDFGNMHHSFKTISKQNEVEAVRVEEQIKREFEKLHEFLRDEEKMLLTELQEEAQCKHSLVESKMKQLMEDSQALLSEARQLHAHLEEDDCTFLMTHRNRKRRITCTTEKLENLPSGMLLDVAKYLGSLQYKVWKKMLDIITVVPFTFDPNSAAAWLSVSEDLTSITNGAYKALVRNPERFTSAPCVLGSCGFSTGFHTWEVDLDGVINWRVGVARPCGDISWPFHHDARSGFWYIYRMPGKDGNMCRASNMARSEVALGDVRRIRVELDCDEGELSFYNADHKTHIFTFHETFDGIVFPYFCMEDTQVGSLPKMLRICPLRVHIHENIPI